MSLSLVSTTERFFLAKYKLEDSSNRLSVYFTDPKEFRAIERQRLRGTIVERIQQVGSRARVELEEIHIESSIREIRAFLKKHPDVLFQSKALEIEPVKETD